MERIKKESLILGADVFAKPEIEKRMADGGFNSLAKFELFVWDLEMFLQIQKRLGDKIILKGGAATQFYIPIAAQRTSIDIDMICLAPLEEVHNIISEIETALDGEGEYCKFRLHEPKNPRLELCDLKTYYETVPSICNDRELFATRGRQEVKIEFLFSNHEYPINKIAHPQLFAIETDKEFNVLALEMLFADKLTTLGPATIGVSDERADEQFKQIYDVITLFVSNMDQIIANKELIRSNYKKVAEIECQIHRISYDADKLFADMKLLINRVKNIESDSNLLQRAKDFQALYLRNAVNRDKAQWAIVGYQLDLLVDCVFQDDIKIKRFKEIEKLIDELKFDTIRGPERGQKNMQVREALRSKFSSNEGLSADLFRKRIDRIIWELFSFVSFDEIVDSLREVG